MSHKEADASLHARVAAEKYTELEGDYFQNLCNLIVAEEIFDPRNPKDPRSFEYYLDAIYVSFVLADMKTLARRNSFLIGGRDGSLRAGTVHKYTGKEVVALNQGKKVKTGDPIVVNRSQIDQAVNGTLVPVQKPFFQAQLPMPDGRLLYDSAVVYEESELEKLENQDS